MNVWLIVGAVALGLVYLYGMYLVWTVFVDNYVHMIVLGGERKTSRMKLFLWYALFVFVTITWIVSIPVVVLVHRIKFDYEKKKVQRDSSS